MVEEASRRKGGKKKVSLPSQHSIPSFGRNKSIGLGGEDQLKGTPPEGYRNPQYIVDFEVVSYIVFLRHVNQSLRISLTGPSKLSHCLFQWF